MNAYFYSLFALDVARERMLDAERDWLAKAAFGEMGTRPSRTRRLVARLLAAVSRSAASAVRRLDARVADDLGRKLAPAE